MKKRFRILLTASLLALTGVITWLAMPSREPVYQGKTLTAWLTQDVANMGIDYELASMQPPNYEADEARKDKARAEAENAVRQIGTNALPYLIKLAAATDSPLKLRLIPLLDKQSILPNYFRTSMRSHMMAGAGFASLRSEATPAVPALIKLLYQHPAKYMEDGGNVAASCLSLIGAEAVPDVLPLLTNKNSDIRENAAKILEWLVPNMVFRLGHDDNETNRRQMAVELAEIGKVDADVTNALVAALKDKSLPVRTAATNALQKLDPKSAAKSAAETGVQ